MRPLSPKMLEWLNLLRIKPGSTRRKSNIAYRCMQRGLTEWNYVNNAGETMTWAVAKQRYGDRWMDHVRCEGERLTAEGMEMLEWHAD